MSKRHKKKKWQDQLPKNEVSMREEAVEQPEQSEDNNEKLDKISENTLLTQDEEANLFISKLKNFLPWKSIIFFLLSVSLLLGLNFALQYGMIYYFKDKVLPGITVNNVKLAYMSYEDAWQTLNNRWENYWQSADWEILDKPAPVTAFPNEDENLAKQDDIVVLKFLSNQNYCHLDEKILREQVFSYGQNQWWIKNVPLLWQNKEFTIPLICDNFALHEFLHDQLLVLESPEENARYQFDSDGNLLIIEGKVGRVIDYEDLLLQVKSQLPLMNDLRLLLKWQIVDPQVNANDLEIFKPIYLDYLEKNVELQLPKWNSGLNVVAVTRSYDDMRNSNPEDLNKYYNTTKDIYTFTVDDLRIDVKELSAKATDLTTVATFNMKNFSNDFVFYKDDNNHLLMKINEENLTKWFNDFNDNIKIEAVSADLEMEEISAPIDSELGQAEAVKKYRVKKFISPKLGRSLDVEGAVVLINDLFHEEKFVEKLVLPMILQNSINEGLPNNPLQIQELIGLGISNFSGSPYNRIHNIKIGATKLNGLLLAPGEEFKALPNLKPFTAAGGYLAELVIKGTETIPEYGGGLCQVATTLFRAAIDAGLPITERRPHRYDVSYYKPTGTDATIYDPHPDVRFVNDTGHYILFQSYTIGNNLYIELWGVPDGRLVEQTDAIQYNYIYPPAAKYVDTTDLAPGVIKQKESPHIGVTGEFWWRVIYPDGKISFKKWISKYSPWQQVFLRGVEATSTNASETEVSPNIDDGSASITSPDDLPAT